MNIDWEVVRQLLLLTGEYVGTKAYVEKVRRAIPRVKAIYWQKGAKKFVEGWDEMQKAQTVEELDNTVNYHVVEACKALGKKQKLLGVKELK